MTAGATGRAGGPKKYHLRAPYVPPVPRERLTGQLQALVAAYGQYPGISGDLRRLLAALDAAQQPRQADEGVMA